MSKGVKTALIVAGIVVLIIIISLSWAIGNYNRVVTMDENITAQWSQVENQLKRRYDLIPNLIETVKGYASHEKELFENIAEMRTRYLLRYTPRGVDAAGWHRLEIRVPGRRAEVRARHGYLRAASRAPAAP